MAARGSPFGDGDHISRELFAFAARSAGRSSFETEDHECDYAYMVEVERVTPALWEALKRTRLRALADSPYAFGSTWARESAFDNQEWQRRAAHINWWLAWSAAHPVGIVAMVFVEGDSDERHLVAMWVEPDQRGTGVVFDLVEAVCDQASAEDATAITLWVADQNPRAQRFYAKCGFRPTGERQPLPSAPEVGETLMRRALRPTASG